MLNIHSNHFCSWVCAGVVVWWAPSHTGEEGGVIIYGDGTVFLSFCSWVCVGSSVWWATSHTGEDIEGGGGWMIYRDNAFELLYFCSK